MLPFSLSTSRPRASGRQRTSPCTWPSMRRPSVMNTSPTISTPPSMRLESLVTSIDGCDFLRNMIGPPVTSVVRPGPARPAVLGTDEGELPVEVGDAPVQLRDLRVERRPRRAFEFEFGLEPRDVGL